MAGAQNKLKTGESRVEYRCCFFTLGQGPVPTHIPAPESVATRYTYPHCRCFVRLSCNTTVDLPSESFLPAGTCLLSANQERGLQEYAFLQGKGLGWASGILGATPSPPATPVESPAPKVSPAPKDSPGPEESPAPKESPEPGKDCPVHYSPIAKAKPGLPCALIT
jgi:hypothetical protein